MDGSIVGASCIFHNKIFTFCNRDWNSHVGTNFGVPCGKCSIKLLSDIIVEIGILEISSMDFRAILVLGLIWPNS